MGERFYIAQLDATGQCPGRTTNNRRRKLAWDDEKKERAIEMYTNGNPTPETSIELVESIAEELGETPNGVRMILTKAAVYVKKSQGGGNTSTSSEGGKGGGRVSKADAQKALTEAVEAAGQEIDSSIVEKLTGKACVEFARVINAIKG
jgi:hypothetical protein